MSISLNIADLRFNLNFDSENDYFKNFLKRYEYFAPFVNENFYTDKININLYWKDKIDILPLKRLIYSYNSCCHLYIGKHNKRIFLLSSPRENVNMMMVVNSNESDIDIYLNKTHRFHPKRLIWLLPLPLEDIIFSYILPSLNGILFHSCALGNDQKGILFLGGNESGKSMFAQICNRYYLDINILNEDRIILRKVNGKLLLYGFPWHAQNFAPSYGKVKLTKLFVLESYKNKRLLTRFENISGVFNSLFKHSFLTFDNVKIENIMNLFQEILDKIDIYRLNNLALIENFYSKGSIGTKLKGYVDEIFK